jgi:hypothetical protein
MDCESFKDSGHKRGSTCAAVQRPRGWRSAKGGTTTFLDLGRGCLATYFACHTRPASKVAISLRNDEHYRATESYARPESNCESTTCKAGS